MLRASAAAGGHRRAGGRPVSATVVILPTAAREPVQQPRRRGRLPNAVLSLRAERARREETALQADVDQAIAEAVSALDTGRLDDKYAKALMEVWVQLPARQQASLLHGALQLLEEAREGK
jgi:hypothetical protein